MKKTLLILAALATIACVSWAQQEVYYKSSPTVEWDAPVVELLPGDTLTYEVWILPAVSQIAPQTTADILAAGGSYVGVTADLGYVLAFPYRATWYVGVRSVHLDGGGNLAYSPFAWSSVAGDTLSGVPFWYSPLSGELDQPDNLRDSGT